MLTAITTSVDDAFIARSLHGEEPVEVWRLVPAQRIARFPTVLSPGGRRLAISPDGRRVLAAAWARQGLAAYDAGTGALVWQRRDLRQVQQVHVPTPARAACVLERGPGCVIDLDTGTTIERVPRLRWIHVGPMDLGVLFDGRSYCIARLGQIHETVAAFGVATPDGVPLAAAFGDQRLFLAETDGPLRTIDTSSGHEVDRLTPPSGTHWIQAAWCQSEAVVYLVRWAYNVPTGYLDVYRPGTGHFTEVCELELFNQAFCLSGTHVLDAEGHLRRTSDGLVVNRLEWEPSSDGRGA